MQSWANSFFAVLLLAGPALATPPQVIEIEDILFARNADTLFLVRRVYDNHGLYSVLQTDTVLVQKSLSGGDDRGFRQIARIVDLGPDYYEFEGVRIEDRSSASAVNPYTVFSDFDAWPIEPPRLQFSETVMFSTNGLHIIDPYAYPSARSYFLPFEDVVAHHTSSLAATRFFVPLDRVGGGTTGPDPFDPMYFDVGNECVVNRTLVLRDFAADPALAELRCATPDSLQRSSLWLVVPLVPD